MYLQYFGLKEAPFSITPDPAFVYLSAVHRDALAHLLYGVGQGGAGGFVQLTGEVGTGKTTLCRCILEQVPEQTQVALILNPLMTPRELLASICEELGIDTTEIDDSSKRMVDALNVYLLKQHAAGRRVVVVIDEAQNLSPEALEQVRLLTNLETAKDKLLQMVLLGQPELRQLLQRQNLRQLAQRITARYHLAPLGRDETVAYVSHRMNVAGAARNPFRRGAMHALYQRSGGVPRLINIIADRALTAAYSAESASVSSRMIHEAANEVQPSEERVRRGRWPVWTAAAAAVLAVAVALFAWQQGMMSLPQPTVAAESLQVADESPQPAPLQPDPAAEKAPAETGEAVGGLAAGVAASALITELPGNWLDQQHRQAWQNMAGQWQDRNAGIRIQSACAGETDSGYACLREQGSWARIRQLGLPVLLVLQQGMQQYLLPFSGFSPKGLFVGFDDEVLEIERQAIEEYWFGEYLVVWPQAPGWPTEIRRGEEGAAVDIVLQMAALADNPWMGGNEFDAAFETWLMAFQRRNGLDADGIVGPNTLIHLMAPTIDQPRLVLQEESS